ncbi:sensor histidine kinase [Plantactinospora sp. S1510]|uniref:histidine kinase n=1 Tax=Plantactinospora alkalitolerans TaxID=2789879 RepID=A0ABS0GWN9_9ACTN|nr:histidine kinase [Plantactinospora alkalitolerans]MBF9130615.1 sensor histidine kinase [Plantactinospora alkalitolerans]
MLRRHTIAFVRNLAQLGLGLLGLAMSILLVAAASVVVPFLHTARVAKRMTDLGRRLAGQWGGVAVEVDRRPGPPAPQRRADGWYLYEKQLYRSPRLPAYFLELAWQSEDPAALREWLWLHLTPLVGGLAVLVPPALATAGVGLGTLALTGGAVPVLGAVPPALALPVGLALVVLGFGLAPLALRLHARWTRLMLGPPTGWWQRSGLVGWIRRRYDDAWHGAGLTGLGVVAFGGFLLDLVTLLVAWGGLSPQVSRLTRPLVSRHRRYLGRWAGAVVAEPYRPYPEPVPPDADGRYRVGRTLYDDRAAAVRAQRYGWWFTDPATWRDHLWMATNPLFGVLGLVPAVLLGLGLFGLVAQPLWWAPWAVPIGLFTGEWVTPWYIWYGVTYLWPDLGWIPGWTSPLLGLAMAALGMLLGTALLRTRAWYDRLLLAPTRSASLAQRVDQLTETRADAVDSQAAELRRIERDLHDGAQARLIAVGLSLAGVERLIEEDPAAARALVAQARHASATALTELRDLVRGIHPPVLAERGLPDALRAVALDNPVPVRVTGHLPGRLEPPVESAAYFCALEALANATRHGGASTVEIDVTYTGTVLRITVADDGRGGADPAHGSGLRGVRRRLGTFDGVLTLDSPVGGPTLVTVEIPCPRPG